MLIICFISQLSKPSILTGNESAYEMDEHRDLPNLVLLAHEGFYLEDTGRWGVGKINLI